MGRFLFVKIVTFAQTLSDVDKIVAKYPKSLNTTEKLAEKIEKDFNSEEDKARAIFSWIAFNIKYDYSAFLNPQRVQGFSYSSEAEKQRKIKQLNDNLIQKAFKSKKAVSSATSAAYVSISLPR